MTYSYWDGSGHRREIVLNKGTTVGAFLLSTDVLPLRNLCDEYLTDFGRFLFARSALALE